MSLKLKTLFYYLCKMPSAGTPLQAYLIITNICNQRCSTCNFWRGIYLKDAAVVLNTQEIKGLIDQISDLHIPILVITGGEPFLRSDIFEIFRYAKKKIPYFRVQTNGSLINETAAEELVKIGIDEIWISFDGIGATCDRIRGIEGAYAFTVMGIEHINKMKLRYGARAPSIILNTVVSKDNINELVAIARKGIELNAGEMLFSYVADVHSTSLKETEDKIAATDIFSGQFSTSDTMTAADHRLDINIVHELRNLARKHKRAIFIDPLLETGEANRKICRCILLWMNIVITPYGDVVPCQMLDRYVIGNIREKPLVEHWNSRKFRNLRKIAEKGLPICKECCGARRKIIDHLKSPANFKRAFLTRYLRNLFCFRKYPVSPGVL